jgi:hypothetical protein
VVPVLSGVEADEHLVAADVADLHLREGMVGHREQWPPTVTRTATAETANGASARASATRRVGRSSAGTAVSPGGLAVVPGATVDASVAVAAAIA